MNSIIFGGAFSAAPITAVITSFIYSMADNSRTPDLQIAGATTLLGTFLSLLSGYACFCSRSCYRANDETNPRETEDFLHAFLASSFITASSVSAFYQKTDLPLTHCSFYSAGLGFIGSLIILQICQTIYSRYLLMTQPRAIQSPEPQPAEENAADYVRLGIIH